MTWQNVIPVKLYEIIIIIRVRMALYFLLDFFTTAGGLLLRGTTIILYSNLQLVLLS